MPMSQPTFEAYEAAALAADRHPWGEDDSRLAAVVDAVWPLAQARGWANAVAALRDGNAYAAWHGPFEFAQPNWRLHFAEYLEALAEEGRGDGE